MKTKYSEEEKIASKRYGSIKSRVDNLKWKRKDFISWYIVETQTCCYCGCTLEELKKFYDANSSKRKRTRGRTLEIERKKDCEYSDTNCALCCYWCNNAKSDVFSPAEFLNIGVALGKVIRDKIK